MRYLYKVIIAGSLKKFEDDSKSMLLSKIKLFFDREKINFDLSDISRSIDYQSKSFAPTVTKKVTLADAMIGAKAILKYASGQSVSGAEINRRSDICASCPRVSLVSNCVSCGGAGMVAKFINTIRAYKKTEVPIPSNVSKSYCGICSCSIPLMVVTRLEDFHQESKETNSQRPDLCWLKK